MPSLMRLPRASPSGRTDAAKGRGSEPLRRVLSVCMWPAAGHSSRRVTLLAPPSGVSTIRCAGMATLVLRVRFLGSEHTDLTEDPDQVDEGERVEHVIEVLR